MQCKRALRGEVGSPVSVASWAVSYGSLALTVVSWTRAASEAV